MRSFYHKLTGCFRTSRQTTSGSSTPCEITRKPGTLASSLAPVKEKLNLAKAAVSEYTKGMLNVVFAAAEAAPFAKVGGLGDVVGSLPKALAELGHKVIVCIPKYGNLSPDLNLTDTGVEVSAPHQGEDYKFKVLESKLPGSQVPIYFLDNPKLFPQGQGVYPALAPEEEVKRFDVFGKAVFAFLKRQDIKPDIMHLHDWHTSPMAVYLRRSLSPDRFFEKTAAVLSIHNMAYQGKHADGKQNSLEAGLRHSDAWIAVSPGYAGEIRTPEFACGLDDTVHAEGDLKLNGILNGIDTTIFDPKTDKFIPKQYDINTWQAGKAAAKADIQKQFGLPVDPNVMLIGLVTRLVDQKGIQLLTQLKEKLAGKPVQVVVLGNGDKELEDAVRDWNTSTPNLRSFIGFNVAMGQNIYAGSDAFLMPSKFEPCGLGQMIALRYGSVPIIRATGGLKDTVHETTKGPGKEANGFTFDGFSSDELYAAIERALKVYQNAPNDWKTRVENGMKMDVSWAASAKAYTDLYHATQARHLREVGLVSG